MAEWYDVDWKKLNERVNEYSVETLFLGLNESQ